MELRRQAKSTLCRTRFHPLRSRPPAAGVDVGPSRCSRWCKALGSRRPRNRSKYVAAARSISLDTLSIDIIVDRSTSDGKLHDVHALDLLLSEAGAIYVMDRGYVDFTRLYVLHQAGTFFVTRAKSNLDATKGPQPVDAYVGARIRLRRNLLGMSQAVLGHRIGVTFQQV